MTSTAHDGGSAQDPAHDDLPSRSDELYLQDPDVRLLAELLPRLSAQSVIDVGAELGAFAERLLEAGSDEIHLVEPEPSNVECLRERFAGDQRVVIHSIAATQRDEPLTLHKAVLPSGEPLSFGHTVLDRPDTDEIAWRDSLVVTGRSIESLVRGGELPAKVGILKVDTEGNDLAVVSALGDLVSDVVMLEHWTDIPRSFGPCPWTVADLSDVLRPRGFSHFVFLEHRQDFTVFKWDEASVDAGRMGNIVFLRDDVLPQLMPVLLRQASFISLENVERAEDYAAEAEARLDVIEGLKREQVLLHSRGGRLRARASLVAERCRFVLQTLLGG